MTHKEMIIETLKGKANGLTISEIIYLTGLENKQVCQLIWQLKGSGVIERSERLDEGYLYFLTDESLRNAPIKQPVKKIEIKQSALKQDEKTPSETVQPSPIVEKSALTQIVNSELEKLADIKYGDDSISRGMCSVQTKNNTHERIDEFEERIFEDFETRAIVLVNEKTVSEIKHHINGTTPDYYKGKSLQVFDVLDEFLTTEAVHGFYVGNIIKYVVRFKGKNGRADLIKARDYLDKLIEAIA